ncbi:hypothetical protein EDM80_05705 [bacterium]|nr:MAG: hypothetical protein EDM80_05705 [bacterium]RIK62899.1 MAG: hypothetical protein DCC64_08715 [Planctomycetota bacterium]
MEQTPEITEAVKQNKAVVSCVYNGWEPREILAQLPEGFSERSWAAEIVDGRIVKLAAGVPERIIKAWLAQEGAPAPSSDEGDGATGTAHHALPAVE